MVIGGNTLSNVVIETANLNVAIDDERPDGIIGFPLMGGAVVRLNTSDRTMAISDPAALSLGSADGMPIRVDLSDQVPVVPMVIDGRIDVNALLDSGDGSTVAMSQQLVTKRHIPILASNNVYVARDDPFAIEDYVRSHMRVTGIGGDEIEACSTIASIALGPINYQGTYACTSASISGDNIIVGYDFLRNFDMVFDYHDGLLVLNPHAH